jgi:hypothetical protein
LIALELLSNSNDLIARRRVPKIGYDQDQNQEKHKDASCCHPNDFPQRKRLLDQTNPLMVTLVTLFNQSLKGP